MLEISREIKSKLKRYLINADPFLWGVLEGTNKKKRLKELKGMGYLTGYSETANPNYSKINQDLLVEIGIEGILEHIVVLLAISESGTLLNRTLLYNQVALTSSLRPWL